MHTYYVRATQPLMRRNERKRTNGILFSRRTSELLRFSRIAACTGIEIATNEIFEFESQYLARFASTLNTTRHLDLNTSLLTVSSYTYAYL